MRDQERRVEEVLNATRLYASILEKRALTSMAQQTLKDQEKIRKQIVEMERLNEETAEDA